MKKTLFASAFAFAALVSAPAFAQVSGFVGASAATTDVEVAGAEFDGESYGVAGSVAAPVGGLTLQFDGALADSDDSDVVASAAAHLAANLNGGRVAGFVAAADTDDTTWAVGVEGEAYASDQFTLAGTLAYLTNDDVDVDGWAIGGQGRYFVADNFRIDGSLGYTTLESGPFDLDGWTAGVGAEYQFTGTPVSVFGGYTRAEFDDADLESDTFAIGVRFNFGGDLKQRDRGGASLRGLDALTAGLPF